MCKATSETTLKKQVYSYRTSDSEPGEKFIICDRPGRRERGDTHMLGVGVGVGGGLRSLLRPLATCSKFAELLSSPPLLAVKP